MVIPPLARVLITMLAWTGCYPRPKGLPSFPDCRAEGPSILVFWHGRTLMHLYFYRNLDVRALVSRSRDGELLARTLVSFGFSLVRGSSSRGGFEGMRGLLRALKSRHDVTMAPDGPRGPALKVQGGVIALAQLSGAPIRPVAWSARWAWRANSWDQFMIPLPFSPGSIVWGAPIHVPRNLNEREKGQFQQQVTEALEAVTGEADRLSGRSH